MSPLQGVLVVVEAVAASVLLPPMAWLLAKTYRRSAAGRRLVWITAFAMLLGLPLLAAVAPSLTVITLPAPDPLPAAPPVAAAAVVSAPDPGPSGLGWFVLIPLAAAVWLAGVAKLGAEHLFALVRLELMRRKATPWPLPAPVRLRGCDLMMSEDCPGPMTWGVFRPVIMLPDEALDWPADRLATVLRHEMAHVRRRDGLAQALAVTACALYWPNPLVWGAARALRREAELAADDAVIAAGVKPSDYAGQLLELAAEWRERRLTPTGLAMAAPPALSQRVQSILSTDAVRTGATAMDTFKLVLLGGAATAALTLARPSVAETPAPTGPSFTATPAGPVLTPAPAPGQALAPPPAATPAPAAQRAEPRPMAVAQAAPKAARPQDIQESSVPPAAAPPAPPATPAPQPVWIAGPAPAAAAAAPLPPLPPGPPQAGAAGPFTLQWLPNPNPGGPQSQRVVIGGRLTPEQRADLDRKLAAIGPAVDKAIKDAHIDETVQKALSAQDAKTREEVAKQLQQIGPLVQQAIAAAQIREMVGQRFAQLTPDFEAARKQAQERQAQAEDRVAAQLEEQAKRARERAQRARDQLKQPQSAPQPAPAPKN